MDIEDRPEHASWSTEVFQKDKYTPQLCNNERKQERILQFQKKKNSTVYPILRQ